MDEAFLCTHCAPSEMDWLWARGWRHFGSMFFRYSTMPTESGTQHIVPLRIDLSRFAPSKSQRRVLRRNADLQRVFRSAALDEERASLFVRHATRFRENIPPSLESFLGPEVAHGVPCEVREVDLRSAGRLLAASFIGIGSEAFSSIYAIFEPAEPQRSLGIATLLEEIAAARLAGCRWLYLGYATREASHYDYKKGFDALEWFDWEKWRQEAVPRT